MYVFVYGTLKDGRGNDHLLKGSFFINRAITMERFVMTNCGFPYLIESEFAPGLEAQQVMGELYEIDEGTLERLDWLEGFAHEGYPGNHYNRETTVVQTEDGVIYETFVYICNSTDESTEHTLPLCNTEEFMDKKVYVY